MTGEAVVSIRGLQDRSKEEETPVELVVPGHYLKREGRHFIGYEEEGEGQRTQGLIRIGGGCVEVTRRGFVRSHMVFEKGRKSESWYETPYGAFRIGITTNRVDVCEEENRLRVRVDYLLEIDAGPVSACELSIDVRSRGRRIS